MFDLSLQLCLSSLECLILGSKTSRFIHLILLNGGKPLSLLLSCLQSSLFLLFGVLLHSKSGVFFGLGNDLGLNSISFNHGILLGLSDDLSLDDLCLLASFFFSKLDLSCDFFSFSGGLLLLLCFPLVCNPDRLKSGSLCFLSLILSFSPCLL